jgi:hypothetical protein
VAVMSASQRSFLAGAPMRLPLARLCPPGVEPWPQTPALELGHGKIGREARTKSDEQVQAARTSFQRLAQDEQGRDR